MQIVLRLLCLASLTAGGIKTKNLESIKREILQVCPLFPSELPSYQIDWTTLGLRLRLFTVTTLSSSPTTRYIITEPPSAICSVDIEVSFCIPS